MKRKTQTEGLVKLYREFSRQKYNKYKHKYPKMKESEIIAKVQKEWDAIDQDGKKNLQKLYQQKNYLDGEDFGLSPTKKGPRKMSVEKSRDSRASKEKALPGKLKIVEDMPEPFVDVSESDEDKNVKKVGVDSDSDKSQRIPRNGRKIAKPSKITADTKNKEYLSFYKYYYDKLANQHPKWKPSQTSTIIKLLWRKRIITKKNDNELKKKQTKTSRVSRISKPKRTTGYLTFKKRFLVKHGPGTITKNIRLTFKRLTFEHKLILNRQAQIENNEFFPVKAKANDDLKSKVAQLNISDSQGELFKPLGFLNNVMTH